jgi:hypothetical protein
MNLNDIEHNESNIIKSIMRRITIKQWIAIIMLISVFMVGIIEILKQLIIVIKHVML